MNQPTLFDAPATRGASRRTDPQTSRDAGRSMSGDVLRQQQALVLRGLGHIDCTAYEVWLRLQDEPSRPKENVISKRLGELVDAGMVEPTGSTRPGSSHREQKAGQERGMNDLIIKLDRRTNRWSVYRTGEFARYVTSFPTLHEAEQYVIEHSDEVTS